MSYALDAVKETKQTYMQLFKIQVAPVKLKTAWNISCLMAAYC